MAKASTSLGEASARIQATDLKCRKTPRVRTAPPGLRVEPKWLPGLPGYVVHCQSSGERGALRRFRRAMLFSSRPPLRVRGGGGVDRRFMDCPADSYPRSITVGSV